MAFLDRWWNLRLWSKGLLAIAIPATATVAIGCASYVIGNLAVQAEQRVERSLEVSRQIQGLRASEAEISAGVRAYFITNEETFAAKSRDAITAFDNHRENLVSLIDNDRIQRQRLGRIQRLERTHTERVFALMGRVQAGVLSPDQLLSELAMKEAERLVIDGLLKSMDDDEKTRLVTRQLLVEHLRAELRIITVICALFGVIGGIAISLLFGSGITNRIGVLQRNVARLASGEALESWPSGLDEIGALSEGMARTAEILTHKAAILENALHGIVEADAGGNCLSFNKAFSELAGFPERSGPATILETVHPDDRPKVVNAIAAMRNMGRADTEVRLVPGQAAGDVAMNFLPASNGASSGYFIFVRDIGPSKEAEAALIRAKDAAVASNFAKTEFLAKISHDIRTPLNAILGAADLLSTTPLDFDQAEYVGLFQRNCKRLVALINDFLDFSQIEAGAISVERAPFQIREAVEDAVATFREPARRKGIRLDVEIEPGIAPWLVGDGFRIQQVLVNLLSNAVKFTQVGHVGVRVSASAETVRFEVSDSGPGIPVEDQGRIFAAFTQLENQWANGVRGSGLGLTICRELVHMLGGEISVESGLLGGSIFRFSLPLEVAQPETRHTELIRQPERAIGEAALKILVVEDAEDNRLLVSHYLRGQGMEVEFAEAGQAAVELISQGRDFDLILMDLDLPGIDGHEATRRIRSWEKERGARAVPIVALSAHAMHEAVSDSLAAGCVAHVAKPVHRLSLIDTIRTYARPKRAQRNPGPEMTDQVKALVPRYLASKPSQIEEARHSLASKDFDPIQRFGHNLKGTGTGYGFPRIEEIGKELEQAAKLCDETTVARELAELYYFVTHVEGDECASHTMGSGTL